MCDLSQQSREQSRANAYLKYFTVGHILWLAFNCLKILFCNTTKNSIIFKNKQKLTKKFTSCIETSCRQNKFVFHFILFCHNADNTLQKEILLHRTVRDITWLLVQSRANAFWPRVIATNRNALELHKLLYHSFSYAELLHLSHRNTATARLQNSGDGVCNHRAFKLKLLLPLHLVIDNLCSMFNKQMKYGESHSRFP